MIFILSYLILAIFFITGDVSAQEQDTWAKYEEKYQIRDIELLQKFYVESIIDDPDMVVTKNDDKYSFIMSYNYFRSRVKLTYKGQSRKISPERKEIISRSMTAHGDDSKFAELFDTEFLFIAGSIEYWMPMQNTLIQYLNKEIQKEDKVLLFIVWAGARKEQEKIDSVFLINEFRKE